MAPLFDYKRRNRVYEDTFFHIKGRTKNCKRMVKVSQWFSMAGNKGF